VGDFTQARRDEPAYLPVALPISDAGRRTVLVTGIDLAWLGARLRDRSLTGSSFTIADRNGVMLAREPMPEKFVGTRIAEAYQPMLSAVRPGTRGITGQDGTRRIVGYQPPAATGIGLFVSVGVSTAAAFGPIDASTRRSLALAAIGTAAACFLAWTVGERLFRRPIRRILATIASWRAGDETARTGLVADAGELSALAASIDEYMDNLVDVRAERAAAEERRTLMLREMNHRIKNVLAAVQAIANQTFKDRATPESLRIFGNRLAAMAAAHDLLVSENWERADLHETVTAALDPFGLDRQRRFALDGPPLQITARAALALSMALHELCTNAAKYGALSTPDGQVSVRWSLRPGEAGERFCMSWRERGGPPVSAPSHNGFGTRLIEASLASELAATAELSFPTTGVEFDLDADAAAVVVGRRMEGTAA
jgi:two-component sensor histidine kinase